MQVTLDNAVKGGGFTVTASTSNGTATAGPDYTAISQVLTFAGDAGEIQTLTVPITDDNISEGLRSENFTVSLSGLSGTALTVDITDTGTVRITDRDTAQLTIGDVTVE